jgi:hypothetical protein
MLAMTAGATGSLRAQSLPSQIDLHGFGSWAYRRTNSNDYLGGTPEGSYRSVNFALNVAAAVQRSLTIHGQIFFAEDPVSESVDVDYAFAEWRFCDGLKLRVGKMQLPFGIYTEVFDVGTLRPFPSLPQSIYGPTGFISESAEGIGLRGMFAAGHRWDVQYDVYGAGIDVPENDSSIALAQGLPPEAREGPGEGELVRDAVGARVNLGTPISGLRVGASAYTGIAILDSLRPRKTVLGAHAEYLSDVWWLRSEFVHEQEAQGGERVNGFYIEVARFLTSQWQVAALYDRTQVSLAEDPEPVRPSFLKHREVGLGVNYWFTPDFVLKSSYFFVSGNRFTPTASADPSSIDKKTRLLQLGAEFSF